MGFCVPRNFIINNSPYKNWLQDSLLQYIYNETIFIIAIYNSTISIKYYYKKISPV